MLLVENGLTFKSDVCFFFYAVTQQPNPLISLPHFFSPQRQTEEKGGGQNVERTGEQVLFLWLSPSGEEEVKTFSPLITRETT